MKDPFNILVAGVGGQGNLLCGRVLADATVRSNLRPVVGDTFGASQRGGSVFTHLRIGKEDWAPLIPRGEVDILLGLEPLEALRAALEFASQRTIVIVSKTKIPTVCTTGESTEYPPVDHIIKSLRELCETVVIVDAAGFLTNLGSMKMLNSYILGVMGNATKSPLTQSVIREALAAIFGTESNNLIAFDEGAKVTR
jgi:indolepyruvate ferredoxin oxidoreductase beta subunit